MQNDCALLILFTFNEINCTASHLNKGAIPRDLVADRPLTAAREPCVFEGVFAPVNAHALYGITDGNEG